MLKRAHGTVKYRFSVQKKQIFLLEDKLIAVDLQPIFESIVMYMNKYSTKQLPMATLEKAGK